MEPSDGHPVDRVVTTAGEINRVDVSNPPLTAERGQAGERSAIPYMFFIRRLAISNTSSGA
jgi:hypothetical protein